jgi:hypothetical protein
MVNQTPAWADAVRTATRSADVSRLYVLEDGRQLLLPLLRRLPLPGLALDDAYPPRWGYGDLLASGGVTPADVGIVLTDLVRNGRAARTRLLVNFTAAARWEAGLVPGVKSLSSTAHVLDLDGGFQTVWNQRFAKTVRTATRKAEKSGVTVQRSTCGELTSTFYDIFLRWTVDRVRGSGVPPRVAAGAARRREPLRMFESVAAELGTACRQWVAWHQGEPVAALITLVHGDHATAWRGYGRKALAGPVRAVNLLDTVAIEDACESGCRFFSFGQSGGVVGLERYKESFGATPYPTGSYVIERLPITRMEALRGSVESGIARLLSYARPRGRSDASAG